MKHIRMPKALAEKWLADLRSGEYKQCRGKLCNGVGYCCLGVLIKSAGCDIPEDDIDGDGGLPALGWLENQNIEFFNVRSNSVHRRSPYITAQDSRVDRLNDTGTSFSEIADLLETEIEYNDE